MEDKVTMPMSQLRQLIKETVGEVVNAILPAELNSMKQSITEHIDRVSESLEGRMVVSEGRLDTVESDIALLTTAIDEIKTSQAKLDRLYKEVQIHANRNEQYSRRNSVRFMGLPVTRNENCIELVTDLARDKLDMTLIDDDFEAVHREGKRKDDNQPLHVKFHRRRTRDLFIS